MRMSTRVWNKRLMLCSPELLNTPLFLRCCTHLQTSLTDACITANTKRTTRPFEAIPGPKGFPFVGSIREYMGEDGIQKMFKVHQQLFQKYGPIFRETLFGRTIVNIMEPTEYVKVFRSEGKYPHRSNVEAWLLYRQRRNYSLGLTQA